MVRMGRRRMVRKKQAGRRRGVRKAASKRNPNNIGGPNTCKVIETIPSIPVNMNTPYLINKAGITGTRAPAIAQQFGLYRIAQIKFTIRPLYDTYAPGLPAVGSFATQLPTLYWKLNRYGDNPAAFGGDYMRSLGAKPLRLDDKNLVWSYKPNILTAQNNTGTVTTSAGIKVTPWLSTDDRPQDNVFTLSTALHYGHTMFVEGAAAGGTNGPCANMDIQVVYEFKNPRVVASTSNVGPGEQVNQLAL